MRAAVRTFRYQVAETVMPYHGEAIDVSAPNMMLTVFKPVLDMPRGEGESEAVVGYYSYCTLQTGDEVSIWPCPSNCPDHPDEKISEYRHPNNLRQ